MPDEKRYNLNDRDLTAMDTFYLLDPAGEEIPRYPTHLIRLESSSPCWVAYAKSGADSGSDLLYIEAWRIYLDCAPLTSQPVFTFGAGNAPVL